MGRKVRITESQLDKVIKEQLIGGFVAPGEEATFTTEKQGPNFGNFIMCSEKLLESGVTIGELIDKLTELPPTTPKEREPNNDYEYPKDAQIIVPMAPM